MDWIKHLTGFSMDDERAISALLVRYISDLSREQAMNAVYEIRHWIDAFAERTFGPKSWSEFRKRGE